MWCCNDKSKLNIVFSIRFGSGYTLQIKIQPKVTITETDCTDPRTLNKSPPLSMTKTTSFASPDPYEPTELKQFVANRFPGSVLVKEHQV